MSLFALSSHKRRLEADILSFLCSRERIQFAELAQEFCDHSQDELLRSLGQLHRTQHIDLFVEAHDVAIVLRTDAADLTPRGEA